MSAKAETPRVDECLSLDNGGRDSVTFYRILSLARIMEGELTALSAELEHLFADRERRMKQVDHLISHLSYIHLLIQPDAFQLEDGRRMEFCPPPEKVTDYWKRLSKAIRDIPTAIDAAMKRSGA